MDAVPGVVVVAVGHEPMHAALKYALDEALRVDTAVHLIHALPRFTQGPEVVAAPDAIEQEGLQLLHSAEQYLMQHAPVELVVTKELVEGPVVLGIARAAVSARTVVLQRRPLPPGRRTLTQSITSGVVARCPSPVVSVPARWAPVVSWDETPTVTVGIDDPDDGLVVLQTALEEARMRQARLKVVHARKQSRYAASASRPGASSDGPGRSAEDLDVLLARVGTVDVDVVPTVTGGPASDVLLYEARSCDLLVIGRHDSIFALVSHLGPVARTLLHGATCPVLLVGEPRADRAPR